jgi:ferritin-like metal-binding protein YciE
LYETIYTEEIKNKIEKSIMEYKIKIREKERENEVNEQKLREYQSVECEEFNSIVEEYQSVLTEIEQQKWMINELNSQKMNQ